MRVHAGRWLHPGSVVLFGVLASAGSWRAHVEAEERALRAEFELHASESAEAIEHSLGDTLFAIEALGVLLASGSEVGGDEFRRVAQSIRADRPGLAATGWYAQAEGRDDRYELVYAEARDGYGDALVARLMRSSPHGTAIARAAATGEVGLSAGPSGVLALVPVRRTEELDSADPPRFFAVGALRVDEILEAALDALGSEFEVRLSDVTDPTSASLLHEYQPLDGPLAGRAFEIEPGRLEPRALAQSRQIEAGGLSWRLDFVPTPGTLAARRTYGPWRAFVGGLAVTTVLAAFLVAASRRARRLGREIEQRREAESALRESEQRLRLTLDAVSDGGWDWRLRDDELRLSDKWFASLGYAPGEFEPWPEMWLEHMHPEDHGRFQQAVDAHLSGVAPRYECEFRMRSRDGEWRWFRDRGAVVERDDSGEPLRMVGAQTEITDRKRAEVEQARLEARVRQAQKLESLGVLSGGIAHDFNNLLAGIVGNADLALMIQPADAAVRPALREIRLAAQRAADLTRHLLAYAGGTALSIQTIDLSSLVDEMLDLLRASISKNARLGCDFATDIPAIEGDPTQLRQVVMNLITNASDALGDDSGAVLLRTGFRAFSHEELAGDLLGAEPAPGRYVFLEVADTGCGMDESTRNRIFDPFFTTKFHGRGLGLAAVLGIVSSHGGAILLETKPAMGTRFRLLFSASEKRAPGPGPRPAQAILPSGLSVLVVDDEETVRTMARRALEHAGARVLLAANGDEALRLFRAEARLIDAVILDLTMPGMGGKQVMEAMREIRRDVPILLSSGWTRARSLAEFGADGPLAFLGKPYRVRELLSKLAAAVAGESEPTHRFEDMDTPKRRH